LQPGFGRINLLLEICFSLSGRLVVFSLQRFKIGV
jgi:hypothetical protein